MTSEDFLSLHMTPNISPTKPSILHNFFLLEEFDKETSLFSQSIKLQGRIHIKRQASDT